MKRRVLVDDHAMLPQQLQQREERDDHLAARRALVEQRGERGLPFRTDAVQHEVHLVRHAPPHALQLFLRTLVQTRQNVLERGEQVEKPKIRDGVGLVGLRLLELGASAAVVERLHLPQLVLGELAGRILELLVFDELTHKVETRIHPLLIAHILRRAAVHRQQHPGLNHHQRGGHHDELARHIKVQLAHHLDILHVLLGDAADRNVVDIELIAANKVQQQIQRPFKDLQIHLVILAQ